MKEFCQVCRGQRNRAWCVVVLMRTREVVWAATLLGAAGPKTFIPDPCPVARAYVTTTTSLSLRLLCHYPAVDVAIRKTCAVTGRLSGVCTRSIQRSSRTCERTDQVHVLPTPAETLASASIVCLDRSRRQSMLYAAISVKRTGGLAASMPL